MMTEDVQKVVLGFTPRAMYLTKSNNREKRIQCFLLGETIEFYLMITN
jgi:hypothetical protein